MRDERIGDRRVAGLLEHGGLQRQRHALDDRAGLAFVVHAGEVAAQRVGGLAHARAAALEFGEERVAAFGFAPQRAQHVQALDVAAAFPDRIERRLPVQPRQDRFLDVAGAAVALEESILPRLYREAPLNGIWEGSGNVICLDVLRAMHRDPACVPALLAEVADVAAQERRIGAAVQSIETMLREPDALEASARRLTESLAVVLQAALLVRHAPQPIADAFLVARLETTARGVYGTLPPGIDHTLLIDRARAT